MFNSTKLINEYCGNSSLAVIYHNGFLSPCFLFTVIENPIYFLSSVVLSYMIGSLTKPGRNVQSIQVVGLKNKIRLGILSAIYYLSPSAMIVIVGLEYQDYHDLYSDDYNSLVNFLIKYLGIFLLTIFLLLSLSYHDYSRGRLIAFNLILICLIIVEILHFSFYKIAQRIFTFSDIRLIKGYIKLAYFLIVYSLFNFNYFVWKRHSLFYESFANYDSSPNIFQLISANMNRRKSILSKFLFSWVAPFLSRAANDSIRNVADCFHLPESLKSNSVKKNIHKTYAKLIIEQQQSDSQNNLQQNNQSIYNGNTSTSDQAIVDTNQPIDKIKLRILLWRCYKNELYKVSYLKLISDVFNFFSPIILNKLINYIDSNDFSNQGFMLVAALFTTNLISSVSLNLYDFLINNICIKVNSTVVNIVYRKLFSLRTSSLHDSFSSGQLVNYTSVDSQRIANFFSTFFQIFSMPIQVIVALYLLYQQIGYSFIAGFIFSIMLIGINKFISFKIALITGKLLAFKDERIKLTTKLITGIKAIKMNSFENIFTKRIDELRRKEMKMLKQKKYLDCVCVYFWATTPCIISFLTFTTFVLFGNQLTAANVFTSLALLNMMIGPLNSIPWVVTGLLESWISMKRVQEFLDTKIDEDLLQEQQLIDQKNEQQVDEQTETIVDLNDVVIEHKKDGFKFVLGPVDLKIKRNEFLVIFGKIGSGKSSLLELILNEIPLKKQGQLKSGEMHCIEKAIGYLPQVPWIPNDTIRNVITFGKPFEYKFFNDIIDVCELRKDLDMFTDHDNTMISDRGQSLSGGQKARISLARALYQSKDIDLFLIDDLFSSLDTHVASKIYQNCILGFLSSKTRVLCTNQQDYIKNADRIVLLENGCVKKIGKPEVILNELNNLSHSLVSKLDSNEEIKNKLNQSIDNDFKEEMNQGTVNLSVYTLFIKAISIPLSICIVAFIFGMQSSKTSSDYWLSYWIHELKIDVETDSAYYLKVFLIIVLLNSLLAAFRSFVFALGCIHAATNLYRKLYKSVIDSNLNFFNCRPIGQIINRFSSDVFHIDENLPFTLNIFLANCAYVVATIVITCYSVPLSSIMILILLSFPYYRIQYLYRKGSMILKRFSTNALSPLYSQFHETLLGLTTIRAYRRSNRFIKHFEEKVDLQNSTNYSLKACTQWLNLRIQLIGICLSSTIALLGCIFHYYDFVQQTSLIGLGLVYSLQITGVLHGLICGFTQLEIDFISVERLIQYFNNEDKEKMGMIKLIDFPKKGEIRFEKVCFKYKNDSNNVLNSLSFKINPGQFIGIVGRTGSGKSSIFQCLFRMYELSEGSIYIDDQNIKLLHLDTLRKSMCILTQDSFLFDGTIRDNLDPYQTLSDADIWQAIEECEAKPTILKLGGLNAVINDNESNLSIGEKQLICIIRAFLCKVKILCLDEATSSIDQTMETNICKTIKKAFAQKTVLMISHRPSSVLNCDHVMVIDQGKLLEYGTPDELICDSNSIFSKMWLIQQNST